MAMQRMHDRINVGKIILDPRMDIDEVFRVGFRDHLCI